MASIDSTSQIIKCEVAKLQDLEQILSILHNDYYPVEPTSFGNYGNGYFHKLLRSYTLTGYDVESALKSDKEPLCIVAKLVSGRDEEIIGFGGATVHYKDNAESYGNSMVKLLTRLPKWVPIPLKVMQELNFAKLRDDHLKFNPKGLFEQLKDADKICEASVLCVARNGRRKSVALKLAEKSVELATAYKCDYYVAMATSSYVQKLLVEKFHFECLHQVSYKDHRTDEQGRPFLDNTGEHKHIKVLARDLRTK